MMPYAPYMLAGLAIATGVLLLLREAVPTQPSLKEAVGRLAPSNLQLLTRSTAGTVPAAETRLARVGTKIDRLLGRLPGFAVPAQDQAIIRAQRSQDPAADNLWPTKFACALGGLLLPLVIGAALQVAGIGGILLIVPAGMGLLLGLLGWAVPNARARSQAAAAREEFLRVAIAFLRLVAIQRLAGALPNTALVGAAEISSNWAFQRIRQELVRAEWARIPTWDALTSLGEQVGVPQLADIGDIMRLAGDGSNAVADSLLARATSLREQLLVDAHAAANASTTTMAIPRTALLVIFMLALFYPVSILLLG